MARFTTVLNTGDSGMNQQQLADALAKLLGSHKAVESVREHAGITALSGESPDLDTEVAQLRRRHNLPAAR
ncbi:MAG TPA: hypothetical protein VFE47_17485 [Tepidisphaeraceae bacterium]|jgi:hypothetical protein|nr:hypothetical protein [Tepidisphaeraceae bacterium]